MLLQPAPRFLNISSFVGSSRVNGGGKVGDYCAARHSSMVPASCQSQTSLECWCTTVSIRIGKGLEKALHRNETCPLADTQVTCTFTIRVVDGNNPAIGVASAVVDGTWTVNRATNGWPFGQSGTTTLNGDVVITATKTLNSGKGLACTFTVNTISASGYSGMDPATIVRSGTISNL